MNCSVVVPVYNSEPVLPKLVAQIEAVLGESVEEYEIILVEDCGRDRSWDRIREIASVKPRVKGIRLSRNYGQHNALLCGIRASSYEVIVTIDDDLQNPPSEIPKLLERLRLGADVVYGVPETEQHGFARNVSSRITKWIMAKSMKVSHARDVSAFRAFRTSLREAFSGYENPLLSIDVLLTWATSRFDSVRVQHGARATGESNYTTAKLIRHALNMVTGYSTGPLRLASLIGFFFTLIGVGLFAYVIGRYFISEGSVPGFPFLASSIAMFSGAQMFAIGILGEYLARMHYALMSRPTYVVAECTPVQETGE